MWERWFMPGETLGHTYLTARMKLSLAGWRPHHEFERQLKRVIRTVAPRYTMVPLDRLRLLAEHARRVSEAGVAGCVVECGTWRGGGLATTDWVFRYLDDARTLWGFDSFEGLPQPGELDPQAAHDAYYPAWCAATEQDVQNAFAAVGGDRSRLHTVKGWLDATLAKTETGPIALLNVDVDWYSSVSTALHELYERVVPGGLINFDDYGYWSGCDRAVHEFLEQLGKTPDTLHRAGPAGAWMLKSD